MKLKRNENWMGQRGSLIIRSIALELVVERTGNGKGLIRLKIPNHIIGLVINEKSSK
jgi:hypothetical protein